MDKRLQSLLDEALRLKARRDFTGSLKVLSTVVGEYPDSAAAFGLMGGIYYYELDRSKEAVACFEKATRVSPRSEMASLGLFHSLWDSGSQDKAIAEMRRFQSLSRSADYDEISAELKEKGILS